MRNYRYFDMIAVGFVSVLLISNMMVIKVIEPIPGLSVEITAGLLLFPFSYIFGDILVEVYGYACARRVIWLGFGASLLMSLSFALAVALPPAASWPHQAAYETILGQTPRIVLASITAYIVGEFVNSYVLARMKVATRGKHLWARTIGSTIFGQGVDSFIFNLLAFAGVLEWPTLWRVMLYNYAFKVFYEAAMTPLTYFVVFRLKAVEGVDHFDDTTDFNPFSMKA